LTLAASFSQAFRINDAGQIVGKSRTEDGPLHATLWEDGNLTGIGTVDGAIESFATDVNRHGVVVGSSVFGADSVAFRWTQQDGFTSYSPGPGRLANAGFNGINSDGLMVGTTFVLLEPFRAAFARPEDTTLTDLSPPGRNLGMALAVNDAGTIVGYQGVDSASPQATIFHADGTLQPLGTLGLEESWAQDVNENGTIVGRAFSFSEGGLIPKAFVVDDAGMFDLLELAVNPQGWELIEAAAINDRGCIAGNGVLDGSVRAFVAIPVPEPTTCALVLWGMLGSVFVRRAVAFRVPDRWPRPYKP
jgi:probable HAF family extracellular repeat protein